jgi:hypothetical protein
MLNKKGLSFYTVMFAFFRMAILMLVVLAIVILIRQFIVSTVDISQAESEIFYNNLVSSPNALAYTDPVTHRVYPRKISIAEFSNTKPMEEKLAQSFWADKPGIAARCALFNVTTGGKIDFAGKTVEPVYFNRLKYISWIELSKTKAKGLGGAKEWLVKQDVLLIWEGKEVPAMLEVSVTIPNS